MNIGFSLLFLFDDSKCRIRTEQKDHKITMVSFPFELRKFIVEKLLLIVEWKSFKWNLNEIDHSKSMHRKVWPEKAKNVCLSRSYRFQSHWQNSTINIFLVALRFVSEQKSKAWHTLPRNLREESRRMVTEWDIAQIAISVHSMWAQITLKCIYMYL